MTHEKSRPCQGGPSSSYFGAVTTDHSLANSEAPAVAPLQRRDYCGACEGELASGERVSGYLHHCRRHAAITAMWRDDARSLAHWGHGHVRTLYDTEVTEIRAMAAKRRPQGGVDSTWRVHIIRTREGGMLYRVYHGRKRVIGLHADADAVRRLAA